MKRQKPFIYYRSKEFKALIEKFMQDINYSRHNRFVEDLLTDQSFEIKNVKPRFQGRTFTSYKSNLDRIEQFFIECNDPGFIDESNNLNVSDFPDLESLIEDMHIENIETVKPSEYSKHSYTANGNVGLNVNSKQFYECYLRIIETTLYLFDSLLAQPKLVQLTPEHTYLKQFHHHLDELSDFKDKHLTKAERGITKTLVTSPIADTLKDLAQKFKEPTTEELKKFKDQNRELNKALVSAVDALSKVESNKESAMKCVSQIERFASDLNNVRQLETRTNTDFVYSKLKQIKIVAYVEDPTAKNDIEKFISNMNKLNDVVKEFHTQALKPEVENKVKLQLAKKVKHMLRLVAIRNYHIVSKYQK
ncbi:hypothetical protein MOU93_003690 [Vibrio parahaemolyticus]|nr:hypothetical protein [Vibrio parahaemolyticus]